MDKEQLKKLYYYIGPFVYKNKLVRIFRTKTNYNYVFYYDKKGELELVNAKETQELTKMLTPDSKNLFDLNLSVQQAKTKPPMHPRQPLTKPNIGKSPEKSSNLEPYSESAKLDFVLRDSDGNIVTVSTITATHIPKKNEPALNVPLQNIQALANNIEKLKSIGVSEDLIKKAVERINGYNLVYDDMEKGRSSSIFVRAGYCNASKKLVKILSSNSSSLNSLERKDGTKVLSHEFFHVMSSDNENSGLKKSNGAFVVFNEIYTELLTGPNENGEYSYTDFVNIYASVFGTELKGKNVEAYLTNNPEELCTLLAEEIGVSVDEIKQFSLVMDTHLGIIHTYDANYDLNRDLLKVYEKTEQNYATMFQICKLKKEGKSINDQVIEELATKSNLPVEQVVQNITSMIMSGFNSDSMQTEIKQELLFDIIATTKYGNQVISSVETLFRTQHESYDNLGVLDALKEQGINNASIISQDMEAFLINTLNPEFLLKNFKTVQEKFSPEACEIVENIILKSKIENKIQIMASIYEQNRDVFKDMVLKSLTGTHVPTEFMREIYGMLTPDEQVEVLTNACKKSYEANKSVPGSVEVLDVYALYDIITKPSSKPLLLDYQPLPNQQITDLIFNTITQIDRSILVADERFFKFLCYGEERSEVIEKIATNMLGQEKYNEIKETFIEYIEDEDYDTVFYMLQAEKENIIKDAVENAPEQESDKHTSNSTEQVKSA